MGLRGAALENLSPLSLFFAFPRSITKKEKKNEKKNERKEGRSTSGAGGKARKEEVGWFKEE